MLFNILFCCLLPFAGTALGAAAVLIPHKKITPCMQTVFTGFAAGVMTAASIWSLILPAIARSAHLGRVAFLPALGGIWAGFIMMLLLEHAIQRFRCALSDPYKTFKKPCENEITTLAITLHNIPEGMVVGIAVAAWLTAPEHISARSALALALGIAVQNIPEGAVVSLPLLGAGYSPGKAFIAGVISGMPEPVCTVLAILALGQIKALLPLLLGAAAGAMLYVVVKDMIPAFSRESYGGSVSFMLGFSLMMVLDVALG